jgi:hypothetical protein
VLTLRDLSSDHSIELGAEFTHGLPDGILQPLKHSKILIPEVHGDSWCKESDLPHAAFVHRSSKSSKKWTILQCWPDGPSIARDCRFET